MLVVKAGAFGQVTETISMGRLKSARAGLSGTRASDPRAAIEKARKDRKIVRNE